MQTMLEVEDTTKYYYMFYLEETQTSYFGSKIFSSYEWLSRFTGSYSKFRKFAPTQIPIEQRSKEFNNEWLMKIGVKVSNKVTYMTYQGSNVEYALAFLGGIDALIVGVITFFVKGYTEFRY